MKGQTHSTGLRRYTRQTEGRTVCRKASGLGPQEGGAGKCVWRVAHREPPKCRGRRTSTPKSIKTLVIAPKDSNPQSKPVAAEAAWAQHAEERATSSCFLDRSPKPSEGTLFGSQVAAEMPRGRTRCGGVITQRQPISSSGANNRATHRTSSSNRGHKRGTRPSSQVP